MPTIPTRENSVVTQKPAMQENLTQAMPQAASEYSKAPAESMANLGQSVSEVGQMMANHAVQMRKEEVTKKSLEISNQAHQMLGKYLYDNKDGLLTRKGNSAEGSSLEYDRASGKIFEQITEGVTDEDVKVTAQKIYDNAVNANRDQVIQHEAVQMRESRNAAAEATVNTMLENSMQFKDPVDMLNMVNTAGVTLENNMRENGAPEEEIAYKVKQVSQKAIEQNLMGTVATDPVTAKRNLELLGGKLDPDVAGRVAKAIDGKLFELKQPEFWSNIAPSVAREDGSYDTEKIRSVVEGLNGVSPEMKDKLFTYFKGRANEAESNFKQGQANNNLEFMNAVYKMKKDGSGIDQVKQTLLKKYATYGPKDIVEKEKDINKAFEPPTDLNDDEVYSDLYMGVKSNRLTDKDISAMRDKLTTSHYESLQKEFANNVLSPQSGFASANDEIDNIIRKEVGNNKNRVKRFKSALYDQFGIQGGGTAKQLIDLAREEAKKVGQDKWVIPIPIINKNMTIKVGGKPRYQIQTPDPDTPEWFAVQRINETNAFLRKRGKPLIDANDEIVKNLVQQHPEWSK
jgi:hypothetical protein